MGEEDTRKWHAKTPGTYIIGSGFDLLVEFMLVLIPERRVAHKQDVQDDACVDSKKSGSRVQAFRFVCI